MMDISEVTTSTSLYVGAFTPQVDELPVVGVRRTRDGFTVLRVLAADGSIGTRIYRQGEKVATI